MMIKDYGEPVTHDNGAILYNPHQRNPFTDQGASLHDRDGNDIVIGGSQDEQGGAVGIVTNEYADRLRDCYNACAGMADSAKDIEYLKETERLAREWKERK
jgi:hypothetical protein